MRLFETTSKIKQLATGTVFKGVPSDFALLDHVRASRIRSSRRRPNVGVAFERLDVWVVISERSFARPWPNKPLFQGDICVRTYGDVLLSKSKIQVVG